MLNCEIIEPKGVADAAVIWLHGLGASGHDFVPVVPHLGLPEAHGVRFIFPHAPEIPVTINGGMVMPAWYDILAMSIEREIDHVQIESSAAAVRDLIQRELDASIRSDRIVLAGFSQGGAVVYHAALSYSKPLAGLLTMSTYFATAKEVSLAEENKTLPIHIFHGSQDPMVPESMGHSANQILQSMGFSPVYRSYPMQHEVCAEEIADIGQSLKDWLRLA
ncbi:Carboxylesterase 2 [Zhongshania aliphaticivorans]|uniref:Carboxylesterase 2 n=1 Tax=Zhongshania aliphaticivorans TaxID=1470434 RepID=A0A5S9P392_9GAMM|nr:carboxylesterase [Zhongshania aliphaticivorans]CAA0090315.1 Carboxylesterase 2 [Zhongshania aliphaticivorans]CAA0097733.1 Carboxylesterase 2 [Zhongshania aliphaticivorans]